MASREFSDEFKNALAAVVHDCMLEGVAGNVEMTYSVTARDYPKNPIRGSWEIKVKRLKDEPTKKTRGPLDP